MTRTIATSTFQVAADQITRTQLMLTNPTRVTRLEVSQGHQTWYSSFGTLGMVSH